MSRNILLKKHGVMKNGKKPRMKVIAIVSLVILVPLLLSVVPNLVFQSAQFSPHFLQTFDPSALDPAALRQQLEASDVYEVSPVPYPDAEIVFWNLFVPESPQYDIQLLFQEGMQSGGFNYEIQCTRFPGLALRDTDDSSPFYALARQAEVYCHAAIASPTCIIQVHTCGETVDECVAAAETVLLDLFQDLSQYQ